MAGRKVDAGWVTIEFSPSIEGLQNDLRGLAGEYDNLNGFLRKGVREVIVPSIRRNFQAGGRPRWQPLAGSTVERRTRQGTGTQILVEHGRLERAATQFARWDFDKEKTEIGNWPANVITRAAVHQNGATVHFAGGERKTRHRVGRIGSRRKTTEVKPYTATIPPRPFLLLQDEDVSRLTEMFGDWVEVRARRWWH